MGAGNQQTSQHLQVAKHKDTVLKKKFGGRGPKKRGKCYHLSYGWGVSRVTVGDNPHVKPAKPVGCGRSPKGKNPRPLKNDNQGRLLDSTPKTPGKTPEKIGQMGGVLDLKVETKFKKKRGGCKKIKYLQGGGRWSWGSSVGQGGWTGVVFHKDGTNRHRSFSRVIGSTG